MEGQGWQLKDHRAQGLGEENRVYVCVCACDRGRERMTERETDREERVGGIDN
jgi:hypothetical protein